MKKYIYIGAAIAVLGMVATIIGQYRIIQQEKTKQVAIKNPAERKAEVVERVITRTITKEGKPIEVVKEVIRKETETRPIVPTHTSKIIRFYVSASYGTDFTLRTRGYGCGMGYNFSENLSTGIRYDTIGAEQRIAVEVRINF